MRVLWDFCLRQSRILFAVMTITTTISHALEILHTFRRCWRWFHFLFAVFHHCQWVDIFATLSWFNIIKVSLKIIQKSRAFIEKRFIVLKTITVQTRRETKMRPLLCITTSWLGKNSTQRIGEKKIFLNNQHLFYKSTTEGIAKSYYYAKASE